MNETYVSDNAGHRVPALLPAWTPTFDSNLPIAGSSDVTPVVAGQTYVLCNPGTRSVSVGFGTINQTVSLTSAQILYFCSPMSHTLIKVPEGMTYMYTNPANSTAQMAAITIA